MSEKAKVVLTDYVWEKLDVENEILGALADVLPLQVTDPDAFFPEAGDCDALLNTYAGPITADVMAKMPNCKIIARYGIGVDTIDLDAATEAGIIVTNNPTYCIEEVAEHTMAMLLTAARKIAFYDRLVRDGRWEVPPGKPMFRLAGSTVGLVGFGNIARHVAKAAAGFDMRVLYADPFVEAGQFDTPGDKVDLPQLLAESDYVCIHAPLLPATRGMIGAEQLAQMKETAVLINCSRGPIIDTNALIAALDAKEIAGCALRPTRNRCRTTMRCAAETTSLSTRTRLGIASKPWRRCSVAHRARFVACSKASGRSTSSTRPSRTKTARAFSSPAGHALLANP
jgi:D-3-phosphoglycerate dehydrogenase